MAISLSGVAWRVLVGAAVVIVLVKLMLYGGRVCAMCLWMSQDGWTPLHVASTGGHVEVVSALIGAGASVNHTNKVFIE